MMKVAHLGALVLLAPALLLAGCGGPTPEQTADAIYSGGTIVTVNDSLPTVEAVAVKDGRILAVGDRATIVRAHRGGRTAMVDLAGHTMVPGFIDAHGHLMGVGVQAVAANLLPPPDGEGGSIADLQRLLRAWTETSSVDDRFGWIIGFGYDDAQLAERRHPTRQDLDQVSRDLPVLAVHQSGHLAAVNSKALELAGITAGSEDPAGGVIRRERDGRTPDGVLEESAFWVVLGALPEVSLDSRLTLLEKGQELYARYGFTTAQEGRATAGQIELLGQAAEQGKLVLDVVAYPDIAAAWQSIGGPYLSREYTHRFRIGGAKLNLDGSPQGKTAWLTKPYHHPPAGRPAAYRGYAAFPDSSVMRMVDMAYASNWQLLVHTNGDAAMDQFLKAARAATERHGAGDRRMVAIHAQTAREDQLDAMRELGVIPSFFSMHTFYWGDWHRDETLGPERAARISPAQSALGRGMVYTSHHDAPVAMPSSIRILSSQVTRTTRSGQVLGPEQRVTPLEALKAITLWAAYQYFEEGSKGSIEPGKLADFAVLSGNPLTVAPEQLADLTVLETIKEGKTVYRAE